MSEVEYITLSSADTTNPGPGTALGNAVFQNSFQYPIVLSGSHEYEVALFSVTLSLATGFDPETQGSLYIYSNFVDGVTVGSSRVNLLRRVFVPDVGRTDINPLHLQYVPISGSSFSSGKIEIRTATGDAPPMDATKGTTITLAIRRKTYSV